MNPIKPLLWLFICLLSITSAASQGYINTFNAFVPNSGGALAYVRDYANPPPVPWTWGQGPPLSKSIGRVEILSLDGTVLSSVKDGTGNALVVDGIFSLGVIAIPGSTPGQPASIILRVWDNSWGATYDIALKRIKMMVHFPTVERFC